MPKPPPPNTRPHYRPDHPATREIHTSTRQDIQTWRRVGYLGRTGAFYGLDERPQDHEASWQSVWIQAESEPFDMYQRTGETTDECRARLAP